MITKKHFNKIAELVERHTPQGTFIIKDDFVKELADFFESDNPNFHRGKFIHACFNKAKNKAAWCSYLATSGKWLECCKNATLQKID